MMLGDAGCNATPTPRASGMPVSDREIYRLAHFFIRLDGEQAGPPESADKWPRIIVAIGEIGSRRQWH
jgi:hypothetical protein